MDSKAFGNRLRELRKNCGATQKMVADYIGVDVTTLAHYESGRRSPNPEKISKLAEYFNLKDEILGVGVTPDESSDADNDKNSTSTEKQLTRELKLTLDHVEALSRNTGMTTEMAMRTLEVPAAHRRRLKAYMEILAEKMSGKNES